MDINIRKSIIKNFEGASIDDIEESINDSISESDEITLPGLGVFFEILWKNSSDADKQFILEAVKKGL